VKYFVSLILIIALYSPDIARIVAYVDFLVDTATEQKVNICDCEDILEKEKKETHTKHPVEISTVFKYTLPGVICIASPVKEYHLSYSRYINPFRTEYCYNIFQPPRVQASISPLV